MEPAPSPATTLQLCCFVPCRMKSGTYLSTGWFTMVLAMELCEQIHIFGMISDGYCRYGRPQGRV